MIGIIDYGAGNLLSVKNALNFLQIKYRIVENPGDLKTVDRIIFPGVGAFGYAVNNLHKSRLYFSIKEWLKMNRSYLGICLGLQLLFCTSEESKDNKGFALFNGSIRRFRRYKVPQIGWNRIKIKKKTFLIEDKEEMQYYYFLHGYYAQTKMKDIIIATAEYGPEYPVIVNHGNIYAVQFHPEKSGYAGLSILKNWVEKC